MRLAHAAYRLDRKHPVPSLRFAPWKIVLVSAAIVFVAILSDVTLIVAAPSSNSWGGAGWVDVVIIIIAALAFIAAVVLIAVMLHVLIAVMLRRRRARSAARPTHVATSPIPPHFVAPPMPLPAPREIVEFANRTVLSLAAHRGGT
jgi:hypothetical protein